MKGNYNFITLLKLCLDEDLHVFTVRLLPLNFLMPCSLLTTWCDLPVSVLLCCKLILQSCKTLCTQTFLDTSQIPFNNPSWGTMSWRPWSLLAFSENLDSRENTAYVQLVSSFWCCRCYEYTSRMYLPTIKPHWMAALEGSPGQKKKTQCQVAVQAIQWSLVEAHQDIQKVRPLFLSIIEDHALSKHSRIVWGIA